MSHQSANPLWLCHVSGHGCDRGHDDCHVDLSCGRRSYTHSSSRTSSLRTLGSFFQRKKKSSPCGPYLPGTFHCEEVVRRRTLSHASRKGQMIFSHNGRIRPELPRPQVIATTTPQEPRANNSHSNDLPRTLGLCPAQQLDL